MKCQPKDRYVCRQHQQQVEGLLVMEERFQSRQNRCFPVIVAQEGPLPTPTLETDPTGIGENQSRSSTGLCHDDSSMANIILVADDVEAQQDGSPSFQYEE